MVSQVYNPPSKSFGIWHFVTSATPTPATRTSRQTSTQTAGGEVATSSRSRTPAPLTRPACGRSVQATLTQPWIQASHLCFEMW